MKFTLQYPMPHPPAPGFLDPSTILDVARAAEAAGFHGIAFTEHPAPSDKWLKAGGHEAFDPLIALTYCAAVTERLRLMPFLLVLPYHQPFLIAKSVASVDVLSSGRMTVIGGTGYLRSEFSALGVDFDERNALLEESITTMRGVWSTDALEVAGAGFQARGVTARPRPVQQPGPPIWLGGNSKLTRRRVATLVDGWSPNMYDARMAATTRTATLETVDDVAAAIAEIRALRDEAGRDDSFDVQLNGPHGRQPPAPTEVAEHIDLLGRLSAVGVTWTVINPPHDDVAAALDMIAAYGLDVISKVAP
ncbi:MAG: LLM class F420-dependent oxidoreductase [Ilumatobacteraceae bacterium]